MEVHILSVFVHGWLFGLHTLGIAYNARRRNWVDVAAHTIGAAYSMHSITSHTRTLMDMKGQEIHPIPTEEESQLGV